MSESIVPAHSLSLCLEVPANLNPDGVKIRMAGTPSRPLWCLADVCRVLAITNPSDVAKRIPDDEKTTLDIAEGAGGPPRTFITEGGLYRVIVTSRTELAEPFRKWVFNEVLPSIRRHGVYVQPGQDYIVTILSTMLETRKAELALEARQHEVEQAQARLEAAQSDLAHKQERTQQLAKAALDQAQNNLGYYSILGWLKLLGKEVTSSEAARHGKRLTGICVTQGKEVHKIRDPRFGEVNTYPESVLSEYFGNTNN